MTYRYPFHLLYYALSASFPFPYGIPVALCDPPPTPTHNLSYREHRKYHTSDRAALPVSLYVKRRLLQQAIESQHDHNSLQPSPSPYAVSSAERDFERRVASGCHTVNNYEDPIKQAVAR